MIHSMLEAISVVLDTEFGGGYKIYMEEVKQDLDEPCFFISCINPASRLFLGKRYFRENQFCIQYFPESRMEGNRECHGVGERLFSCLEWLDVNGETVMGTGMRYEIVDGMLHFFVDYDLFVYKTAESGPVMGKYHVKLP